MIQRPRSVVQRPWSIGLGSGPLLRGILLGACLLCSGLALPTAARQDDSTRAGTASRVETIPARVAALGRLEPGEGVVELGAPLGDRVLQVLIEEGERISQGQLLVELHSVEERRARHATRQAQRDEAAQLLRRARRTGPLAVRSAEAEVRRLKAALALAESDLERTAALVDEEVVPARDLENQQTVVATARAEVARGEANLELERSERRLAIRQANASLATAEAQLAAAAVEVAQSELRSPIDGQVLDILAYASEPTDGGAVMRLGETERMYAVAEVYETDARFVAAGQRATIRSQALPAELAGTVESVSNLVHRNDVLGIDPAADTDSRVMEVRIRLDGAAPADRFVYLQVDVEIDVEMDRRESAQ